MYWLRKYGLVRQIHVRCQPTNNGWHFDHLGKHDHAKRGERRGSHWPHRCGSHDYDIEACKWHQLLDHVRYGAPLAITRIQLLCIRHAHLFPSQHYA